MIDFVFSVEGDPEAFGRGLMEGTDRIKDLSGAWPAVAALFREQIKGQFDSEGAYGRSGAWAPLKPGYAAWKESHYPGMTKLELTGRLRDSLTEPSSGDAITEGRPESLFIGSSVPYARFHQEGTHFMARRPPINPTDRDVSEWTATIRRYIEAGMFGELNQMVGAGV